MDDKTVKFQKDRLDELKKQLKVTLSELFQIDSPDLDFGVYRIMNQKRDEITRFMDKDLVEAVDEEFGKYGDEIRDDIARERTALERKIQEEIAEDALTTSGIREAYLNSKLARDLNEQWLNLRERGKEASMSDAQKEAIFEHLAVFFSRYYKDGDFLSLRRYSANEKYAVPYNGEEVLLHWANKDQYYIKTGRFLKGHGFDVGTYRVMFEVVRAEVQADIKGNNHYFVLSGGEDEVAYEDEKKLLTVRFAQIPLSDEELKDRFPPQGSRQKPNTDDIVDGLVAAIVAYGCIPKGLRDAFETKERDTDANPRLRKHVLGFTKESTSDFFVHKDLGGFLRQELDFYIKNEVFRLDDLGTENEVPVERYVKRAKVLKSIANRIIDFLAQLEDFQKALWEKKKFVLQTDYCMTIDHVPEKHYPAICANERQVQEWKNLYGIGDGAQQTLSGGAINVAFLRNHPYLVLDTAFFDVAFKDRLLEDLQHPDGTPVEDLDEAIGGLMIKSENWQALNLLQERYKEQVKCIYIDPPYNTGSDEFIYRDNYQHSSWLSMIQQGVNCALPMLKAEGSLFISIDEGEVNGLKIQLDGFLEYINLVTIKTKIAGVSGSHHGKSLKNATEYILIYAKDKNRFFFTGKVYDKQELIEFIDDMQSAGKSWKYTSVLDNVDDGKYIKSILDGTSNEIKVFSHENYSIESINKIASERYGGDVKQVYYREIDKIFRTTNAQSSIRQRVLDETKDIRSDLISITYVPKSGRNAGQEIRLFYKDSVRNLVTFLKDVTVVEGDTIFKTISSGNLWTDIQYNNIALEGGVSFSNGKKPLGMITKVVNMASNSDEVILDYFAGSGTTAHAVIDLNREDNGSRKYIIIEMAKHFDNVMKPRIQKVMYSSNWKDGKPKDTDGQSHIFKYMVLEQYEDTLDNIEFLDKDGRLQQTLFSMRDYMLHYFLNFETKESPCRLSVDSMATPFAYTLKIRRDSGFDQFPADRDGFREVPVDLVETFNYLIGLNVIRCITLEHNGLTYRIVHGTAPDNRKITVVWRNSPKKPEDHRAELEEDAAFITEKILAEFPDTATLYVNGHCFVPRAVPIEPEFKKLMGA